MPPVVSEAQPGLGLGERPAPRGLTEALGWNSCSFPRSATQHRLRRSQILSPKVLRSLSEQIWSSQVTPSSICHLVRSPVPFLSLASGEVSSGSLLSIPHKKTPMPSELLDMKLLPTFLLRWEACEGRRATWHISERADHTQCPQRLRAHATPTFLQGMADDTTPLESTSAI